MHAHDRPCGQHPGPSVLHHGLCCICYHYEHQKTVEPRWWDETQETPALPRKTGPRDHKEGLGLVTIDSYSGPGALDGVGEKSMSLTPILGYFVVCEARLTKKTDKPRGITRPFLG